MKRTLIVAICFAVAGLAAQAADAAMIAGQFVPDALANAPVGTPYRLVFVTAGATRGDQTTKTFYDNFVQTEASLSPLFAANNSLYQWQALATIGDSSGAHFFANNVVSGSELVPIYNLASVKVADDGSDLWDGSLDMPVQYDQYGGDSGFTLVWTGASLNGGAASPGLWLGSSTHSSELGKAWASDGGWIAAFAFQHSIVPNVPFGAAVYGVSKVMTVPVPEPSTIVLWSLFTGSAGLVFWRKRRQSN
jgi:hypothetical protein